MLYLPLLHKCCISFIANPYFSITLQGKSHHNQLEKDANKYPPLVMNGTMIDENKTLEVLGFTLNSNGRCLANVDRTVKKAQRRLGSVR